MDIFENKYAWLIAAGVSGSFVGLGRDTTQKTPFQTFLYLFSGFACSFFLAGPISNYFGITEPGELAAVGFGLAVFWQKVITKIGSVIENIKLPVSRGGDK